MKTANIIIAHPESPDKFKALRAFMKAMKIKFEVTNDNPYDPQFVDKKAGKTTKIDINDLWK